MNFIPHLGPMLRTKRIEKKLSIQQVSDKAAITKGMLSKIENGRTIPSLQLLFNVIQALEINVSDFFDSIYVQTNNKYIHIKADQTTVIEKERNVPGYIYKSAFSTNLLSDQFEVALLSILPNSDREFVTTDAYEFKYMIQGSVAYHLDNETIQFEEGDFLFYNGRIPHVPINTGNETAVMLILYFFNSDKQ